MLIIFLDLESGRLLEVGAYLRWAFIQGWALIKFSLFSVSSKYILQQNVKMYQSRILTVH